MKMKLKKNLPLLTLILVPVSLFLLLRCGGFLAGSKTDWIGQHTVLPEYFRNKFYETGNFYPQYAAELGGGQNIYNFAYYGLYHPLYLPAYLLPFVKMRTYIQGAMLFAWCADGGLAYVWLKRHVRELYAYIGAVQLILAAPVVYHSAGQVMFVSYMPFLLLLFWSYDWERSRRRDVCMVLSVIGMILSSFYFSVGGLLFFGIYVFADCWSKEGMSAAQRAGEMIASGYQAVLGVALSAFYLFPVFEAMKGRGKVENAWNLKKLLIPDLGVCKILYSPYGAGLTGIAILAAGTFLFYKKSKEKILAWCVLLCYGCPMVLLILNGGLYIREKALIPMLPLCCLLTAEYLQKAGEDELDKREIISGLLVAESLLGSGISGLTMGEKCLVALDGAACVVAALLLMNGWKKMSVMLVSAVMLSVAVSIVLKAKENLVTADQAKMLDNPVVSELTEKYQKEASGDYRLEVRGTEAFNRDNQNRVWCSDQKLTTGYSSFYNEGYQRFRRDLGLHKATRNILMQDAIDNPLFLRFMGVKYIVGKTDVSGYKKIETKHTVSAYENQETAPMCYLTNQTISDAQFRKLGWAEKQLSLQQYAVSGEGQRKMSLNMQNLPLELSRQKGELQWEKPLASDAYLFLSFAVQNNDKSRDVSIWVQGVKNKLSARSSIYNNQNQVFHYTCALKKGMKSIKVQFGPGDYEITHVKAQIGSIEEAQSHNLWNHKINLTQTDRGDGLEGTFDAAEDCWLITSIPYDDNFIVYIDGHKEKLQRVNQAFLGVKVRSGNHLVHMKYRAKGSCLGWCISGSILVLLGMIWDLRTRINRSGRWKKVSVV